MKINAIKKILLLVTLILFVPVESTSAQIESPTLSFNRGQLWQSVFFGKIGPNYSNWARRGIGLDWPGFDETWIRTNIGGSPSYLSTGGFWVGAKKDPTTVLAVEDWSMYAGTISNDAGAKYRITKHTHRYKNGENYWRKTNPNEGEEVIETQWEFNINYTNVDDRERQLPIRVTRTAHQWSGSKRDENYIIYEYVIKNISPEIKAIEPDRPIPDTLYDYYMLLSYATHANSRSWNILFPSLTPGARNTWHFWDNTRKMIYGRAGSFRETVANEEFGYVATQGPVLPNGENTGEWTAPGFVGVRVLYSSPDNTGTPSRINKFGWSAGGNTFDLSGPFNGIPGTNEAKYSVVQDPALASNFISSSADTNYMRRNRMWSLVSLGPWTILPGDSIIVAIAEIVDGVDYKDALNKDIGVNNLAGFDRNFIPGTTRNKGGYLFQQSSDKAKFTYDQYRNLSTGLLTGNGMRHPSPPAAPKFTVDFFRGEERIAANLITWGTETENIPDPDDGTLDLAGYNLYRSNYLPIGPWEFVAKIPKGDASIFDASSNKYIFIDTTANIGTAYYYSLTAYDTGKASWNINPSAIFAETNSNQVPPLESSIFANRMIVPFTTTFPPAKTLDDIVVVPNPFVLGSEFSRIGVPGSDDEIQFVNVPNPCTIRIYTVRGDLVKTIDVSETQGAIVSWDQTTDFGQFVESGVYIFHVEAATGTKIGKLAIVR